jgi:hypothetical protein
VYIGPAFANKLFTKNGRPNTRWASCGYMERDDAPKIVNDPTGKSNLRRPSYTSWMTMCDESGLRDLFYNPKHGLFRPHPGTKRLTKDHADRIRTALENYRAAHPTAKPGFEGVAGCDGDVLLDYEPDGTLGRLIWLDWWVDWAVNNCEFPVIHNS